MLADQPRRQRLVAVAWIAGTWALAAVTVDQTRVASHVTLPIGVLLAAHGSRCSDDRTTYLAAGIGLLAPLTVGLAGATHFFDTPFTINW